MLRPLAGLLSWAIACAYGASHLLQNGSPQATTLAIEGDSTWPDENVQHATERSSVELHTNDTLECTAPLEILDFLNFNKSNFEEVKSLNKMWPCEVRVYWTSSKVRYLSEVVRFLFDYGTIALIIIGLPANIYSLIVLNSPPINKSNMSVYLKALAVSDIGVLIFNVAVGVLRARFTTINDLYISNKWLCFLHKILLAVFFNYSTWLIVAFSIERLLMIRNPFRIHSFHNEKPAKLTVGILALFNFGIALFKSLTTLGFENDNMYGYIPCNGNKYIEISMNMVPILIVHNIIPTILITCSNISLLILVRQSGQDKSDLNASNDHKNKDKVTRMIILISMVYLVLFLPSGIIGCIELFYRNRQSSSVSNKYLHIEWAKKMLLLRLLRGLFFFFFLLTFVINFFLYCLSGAVFRKTVNNCLPHHIRNICPSLWKKSRAMTTQQSILLHGQSISNKTTRSISSRKNSPTFLVSENGYHNAGFSHAPESNTHL